MISYALAIISDNQSFFQWVFGIGFAGIMTMVGYTIRGIKQDIRDIKEENVVLKTRYDSEQGKIMGVLSEIKNSITRLETKAEHDRPSLTCQSWTKALMTETVQQMFLNKPNPRPRRKP